MRYNKSKKKKNKKNKDIIIIRPRSGNKQSINMIYLEVEEIQTCKNLKTLT